jgi:hypothetical protein
MRSVLRITHRLAIVAAGLMLATGCANDVPTSQSATMAGMHDDPLLSATASPEVQQALARLKAWSASFHDLDGAAAAHYDVLFAGRCIDETTVGVPRADAKGMGYHITRGDVNLVTDGKIDINEPEFLVYAPSVRDAEIAPADRLKASRLVGFEYFLPGTGNETPPELFGEPFGYSPQFGGWVRHLYIWGNNPDGLTADFNSKVPLCADPLVLN